MRSLPQTSLFAINTNQTLIRTTALCHSYCCHALPCGVNTALLLLLLLLPPLLLL